MDRWAEAARFEPAKLIVAGRVRREVADLLLLNSRTPGATRRLALRVAEAALELGKAVELDDAKFQAELKDLRRALDAVAKRDAQASAAVRTPQGIASPGEVAVRVSRGGQKLLVEVSAPAASPRPVNLCRPASSDVVLAAVVEALGLDGLQTGAVLELVEMDLKGGLLCAALPACVGMGRETSGAALYAACTAALSQLNGRKKGEAQAWLAREVAGEMDWSSGRLTAAAAVRLLAAETEAQR
jgi:hypothetical protein